MFWERERGERGERNTDSDRDTDTERVCKSINSWYSSSIMQLSPHFFQLNKLMGLYDHSPRKVTYHFSSCDWDTVGERHWQAQPK